VDNLEVYLLNAEDQRQRRVCGAHRRLGLPSYVPKDIPNPWGSKDPYEEYRCLLPAGFRTPIRGLGRCRYHYQISREGLQRNLMSGIERPDAAVGTISFEGKLKEIMKDMSVEELLDGTRLLWRIEALRQMAEEDMEEGGFSLERAESIGGFLGRMVDMRLKMAKTDNEIVRTQAIAQIVQVLLNGMISIIEASLGPEQAASILKEFKKKLIIPLTEHGYSETLRRQEAAGVMQRIEINPADITVLEAHRDG